MNDNDKRDALRYAAKHLKWISGSALMATNEQVNQNACSWLSDRLLAEANSTNSTNSTSGNSSSTPTPISNAGLTPVNWLGSKGMTPILGSLDSIPHGAPGTISRDVYNSLTGNTWGSTFQNGSSVGVAEIGGRKALTLKLNRRTGNRTNGTGKVQGRIPIEPTDYVKTRHLVYFPEGFDFGGIGMTGKIGPGIFFGDEQSSGSNLKSNGGSFRPCYGQVNRSDRKVHPRPYLYRQDQKRSYGDGDAVPHIDIEREQWIEIIMEGFAQSAPGKRDGQAHMWWNGEMVYKDTNVPWVNSGSVLSNQIIWNFFMGGSNSEKEPELYSPEKDQLMYVAEMAYTTDRMAA